MKQQIEQANEPVPYLTHESEMARSDLRNKRLWMTINILIAGILIYGVFKCQNKTL